MTTKRRPFGLLFILAIFIALAVPKMLPRDHAESAAPAQDTPKRILTVTVEKVASERLVEHLSTTGTLRASEQVELVSEIAGKVVDVSFEEGRRVSAGQVLVRLDASELEAELERARFRLELAEGRESRQRQLREEGVISQEDYDSALSQLNVLRSEQRLIEAQLRKTEIRAPFAGSIGLRQVSPGSYLSPQTPIATLQAIDEIKIDFSVPEQYASRLRPGGKIEFSTKGIDHSFEGTIYAIEPRVDAETRSLTLRARCSNPDGRLLPGAFADVELVVEEIPDAITVPSIAVIPELGGKKVFVAIGDKAEPRAVDTGIRTRERVQITSGLALGDQVITSAIQQMRPGLEIAISGAD